ncbi:unnamed protein product, partial [Laminaria digitata]
FFVIVIDHFTSYTWTMFVKTKEAEAIAAFGLRAILRREAEKEWDKPRTYQSDNGRELKNRLMAAMMAKYGVVMRHSQPYCPRTNGKVENRVKSVSKMF